MRRALGSSVCSTHASASTRLRPNCSWRRTSRSRAESVLHVDIPDLVQQRRGPGPRPFVQQQVVAFGDDKLRLRQHGDRAGDRLLDLAPEFRGIDDVVSLLAQAPQQCNVACAVEGVGRALAVGATQSLQFHVGQMEPVHRHDLRVLPGTHRSKRQRKGRLARPGRADQPEQLAPPVGQQGIDARQFGGRHLDHGRITDKGRAPGGPSECARKRPRRWRCAG